MPIGIYSPPMTLERLLSLGEWTEEKLAAQVRKCGLQKTNQSTINRLRKRTRRASIELALAIEAATGGAVHAEDLPLSRATLRALKRIRLLPGTKSAGKDAAA